MKDQEKEFTTFTFSGNQAHAEIVNDPSKPTWDDLLADYGQDDQQKSNKGLRSPSFLDSLHED